MRERGKRSKEEEEGPLLHAPLPPNGVLRCLRRSEPTFSFSQIWVHFVLLFFDLFFEKFSKKYIGFFPGIFSSGILSLRSPFCWRSVLRATFSALSLGIYRLFDLFWCAASCFAAHSSDIWQCFYVFSISSPLITNHWRVFLPAFFHLFFEWKYRKKVIPFSFWIYHTVCLWFNRVFLRLNLSSFKKEKQNYLFFGVFPAIHGRAPRQVSFVGVVIFFKTNRFSVPAFCCRSSSCVCIFLRGNIEDNYNWFGVFSPIYVYRALGFISQRV